MLISLIRTVIMYAVILLGVRIMGKRQISQLQTSELVVTLLISELAVMPIQEHSQPLWNGLVPMLVLIVCEIVISLIMLKSGKFRQAVCGKPIVVIENGKVLQEQMRRLRMSTEDLFEQLRQNNAFYLDEVAYAIIETNGMMSVVKRQEDDYLTPRLADIPTPPTNLEVVVISDGEISKHSLSLCKKDSAWVEAAVQNSGLSIDQVFIMTARIDGKYHIIPKAKKKK